jgi:hypothetical protein
MDPTPFFGLRRRICLRIERRTLAGAIRPFVRVERQTLRSLGASVTVYAKRHGIAMIRIAVIRSPVNRDPSPSG